MSDRLRTPVAARMLLGELLLGWAFDLLAPNLSREALIHWARFIEQHQADHALVRKDVRREA